MKTCSKCGLVKPAEDFHQRARAKDGLQDWCKSCTAASAADWYRANKDRAMAASTRWNEANPDRRTERKYGMAPGERKRLSDEQGDACAICGRLGVRLVVDHNHDTGQCRGLLCVRCNTMIGYLESPLRGAGDAYLSHHTKGNQ